jgi:hypothetical protein
MMKYVRGSSYRTIYNNTCYVIEQIKAGTTYKDDTMLPGYTEKELDNFLKENPKFRNDIERAATFSYNDFYVKVGKK